MRVHNTVLPSGSVKSHQNLMEKAIYILTKNFYINSPKAIEEITIRRIKSEVKNFWSTLLEDNTS